MTFEEKKILCNEFFNELSEKLKDKDYIVLDSCDYDVTKYLIRKGTADKLSYYGKPEASFRISDHWNWKSSIKKCAAEDYVQCLNVDMPWVRRRLEPGKATKPVYGWQVGFYGSDYKWNVKSQYILRELFNNKEKTIDLLRDLLEALEPDSDKKITDVIDVEGTDILDLPFDNLELSVRSYNCIARYFNGRMRLKDITVRMVRDLAQSGQLPSVRNLGAKSVEEIFGALKRIGVPVTVVNSVSE